MTLRPLNYLCAKNHFDPLLRCCVKDQQTHFRIGMHVEEQNTPPTSITIDGDEIPVLGIDQDQVDDDEEYEVISVHSFGDEMEEDEDAHLDEEQGVTPTSSQQDHSVFTFKKHKGSVFCCDIHPNGEIAVTGGEDDLAYVWSINTGEVFMQCHGHKDSVVFVGFCYDGKYVATIDMSGFIQVWRCILNDEQRILWPVVFSYETGDVTLGLWHNKARVLMCGTATGDIFVFNIPSGETKVLQGNNTKVETAKLLPDGVRLAAGYEDGILKIWDLKANSILHQIPSGLNDTKITAIDIHPEGNLIASIFTDGHTLLTTANNGKVVGKLESQHELEAVAFASDPLVGYLALGTLLGEITIWDSARQMLRHKCAKNEDVFLPCGVTKMFWIKNHLVTGCLDGAVRVFEGRTGACALTFMGHESEVLDMCRHENKKILLTASDDGTAKIYTHEHF